MIYEIFLIFLSLEVKANVLPKRIRVPDRPYLGLNPPLFRHNPIGIQNIGMPMPNLAFMPVYLLKYDASSSTSSGSSSSSEEDHNLHLNPENMKSRKNITRKESKFVEKIMKITILIKKNHI